MRRGALKREKGVELKGDGMARGGSERGRMGETMRRGKNPWGGKIPDPKHNLNITLFLLLWSIL